MSENYAKEIIEKQKRKIENIKSNLNTDFLFPDRNEPRKKLPLSQQIILKIIYSLKVAYLTELSFIFAYVYSKSKFESVIKELEDQNYIKSSVSKDFGKFFCLTENALCYIYNSSENEEISFKEDMLPNSISKLYLHKIQNGYVSKLLFHKMTENLFFIYKGESREFRDIYCREQYVKRKVYPEKVSKQNFSKKAEKEFTELYLPILNSSEEEMEEFKKFIRTVKEQLSDDMVKFSFLKDYYNSISNNRDIASFETYKLFTNLFNTIYRDNFHTYRPILFHHITNGNKNLNKEYQLFMINSYLKNFMIAKRNLTNSKKGKNEEELKIILDKIENLDNYCNKLTKQKESLEEVFEVMTFDGYNEQECPLFEISSLTLETLRNNSIHITEGQKDSLGKWTLTFSIFQTSLEEMSPVSLFKKLEMIYNAYRLFFYSCNMEINIVCYTNTEKELLETKLKSVISTFSSLTEYQMFIPFLKTATVVCTQNSFLQRYEVFKNILS